MEGEAAIMDGCARMTRDGEVNEAAAAFGDPEAVARGDARGEEYGRGGAA